MLKDKDKYCITYSWCFYCWLWPQSGYQCSVSTFELEQVFVNSVWKASNVLKTQKVKKSYKTQKVKKSYEKSISFSGLSLHRIEINCEQMIMSWTYYGQNMNICFSSKFALGILSVLPSFCSVFWSALWSLLPWYLIFFCFHWNNETKWYLIYYADNWLCVKVCETCINWSCSKTETFLRTDMFDPMIWRISKAKTINRTLL